mgnify:CR=1 FL=1
MNITHISVTAARGFNHPYEQFANFKFDLSFEANLYDGEDANAAMLSLQARAEQAAEAHKSAILADLDRKREIAATVEAMEYERRKQFETEASKKRMQELEGKLSELTSKPLLLAPKQIHAGHADHPETFDRED